MNQLLQDKVIVVSGGTKGVGKAVIIESAKQGASVVVGGRDEKAANETLEQVSEAGGDGIFVYTDLRKITDCVKLFGEAYKRFGKIDGFFNYAGVTYAASLENLDNENYTSIFEVNVRAALFCCKAAVKYMKMNRNGGSIVLNGSPHAWGGEQDRVAYACSKGALLTLTEHIAHHYSEFGIRSNYITMGWTPTEGELELRRSQNM